MAALKLLTTYLNNYYLIPLCLDLSITRDGWGEVRGYHYKLASGSRGTTVHLSCFMATLAWPKLFFKETKNHLMWLH